MQNNATARIEGFVTHDPTMKKTKTDKCVCTFSVAVNHFSKADAEPKVSYIEVETWEKLAEMCSNNIAKGKRVMVFGSLRQDRWEGKDGKKQSRIKIVGNEIRFLESFIKSKKEQVPQETELAEAV